jgi:hypothetical protein
MGENGAELFRKAAGADADPLHRVEGGIVMFEGRATTFLTLGSLGGKGEGGRQKAGKRDAKKDAHECLQRKDLSSLQAVLFWRGISFLKVT